LVLASAGGNFLITSFRSEPPVPSGSHLKFFVYIDICVAFVDALLCNVDTVHVKANSSPILREQENAKLIASAIISSSQTLQCLEQCFGGPDFTLFMFLFGDGAIHNRISGHHFPFYRLIKSITKELKNLTDDMH
jgi:hypothetical protein